MSGGEGTAAKKQAYFGKLVKLVEEYNKIFIVGVDNVGSNHMQKIRHALRGKAVVLMGKNTMIRKALRGYIATNPALDAVIPLVRGNVGFVFVKDDLSTVKKILLENKVAAPAKAGAIAPCDVIVPAGNTGLEPTMTSFFQALNIQTKISKGQIEITNDVPLIKEGQKVGASEANLLQKLDIKPFKYGLTIKTVYDNGTVYDAKVLDLSDEDIVARFQVGVKNIAALGLQIGYPTIASIPHSLIRGYKNLLAIAVATDYTFKQAEQIKKYLENPSAFAAAAPAATSAAAPAKGAKEEKPKEEEKKEEEDEDMGFGLFD
jgi:large subunit ribosomal protein LP0